MQGKKTTTKGVKNKKIQKSHKKDQKMRQKAL